MSYDLVFSDHGYRVYRQERQQLEALRSEVARLRVEREQVAREILRLRNDPKALEELAHRELGYVYPDEMIVIMPEKK
jgi:cell division protein FtsB